MKVASAISAVAAVFVERVPVETRPALRLVADAGEAGWSIVPRGEVHGEAQRIARELEPLSGMPVDVCQAGKPAGARTLLLASSDVDPAYRALVAAELRGSGLDVVEAVVTRVPEDVDALCLSMPPLRRLRRPGGCDKAAIAAARAVIAAS